MHSGGKVEGKLNSILVHTSAHLKESMVHFTVGADSWEDAGGMHLTTIQPMPAEELVLGRTAMECHSHSHNVKARDWLNADNKCRTGLS